MSFPYALDVVFGSEHSVADCVIPPKVDEDSNSNSGDDEDDGESIDDGD